MPNISKKIKINSQSEVFNTIEKTIKFALLFAVPAAVALFLIPEMIVQILFERGQFDSFSTTSTASALSMFALGLVAFILIKVLTPIFFAYEDAKLPLLLSLINLFLNTLLSIIFFKSFGFVGIALATTLSAWINAILLYIFLVS